MEQSSYIKTAVFILYSTTNTGIILYAFLCVKYGKMTHDSSIRQTCDGAQQKVRS